MSPRRVRPWHWGAVAVVVILLLGVGAGGVLLVHHEQEVRACTLRGASDHVSADIPDELLDKVTEVRIRVSQGKRARRVVLPAGPDAGSRPGFYAVTLHGRWKLDAPATAFVEGRAAGTVIFRKDESFRFDPFYPNGKDCDEFPNLVHSVKITASDLV